MWYGGRLYVFILLKLFLLSSLGQHRTHAGPCRFMLFGLGDQQTLAWSKTNAVHQQRPARAGYRQNMFKHNKCCKDQKRFRGQQRFQGVLWVIHWNLSLALGSGWNLRNYIDQPVFGRVRRVIYPAVWAAVKIMVCALYQTWPDGLCISLERLFPWLLKLRNSPYVLLDGRLPRPLGLLLSLSWLSH